MKFSIELPVTAQEAKARMMSEIKTDMPPWKAAYTICTARKGVHGNIQDNRFWLICFLPENARAGEWYWHCFPKRFFCGRFEERDGQTRITGKFRFSYYYLIYLCCGFLLMILNQPAPWNTRPLEQLDLIVFVIVLFSLMSAFWGRIATRDEDRLVLEFLNRLYCIQS